MDLIFNFDDYDYEYDVDDEEIAKDILQLCTIEEIMVKHLSSEMCQDVLREYEVKTVKELCSQLDTIEKAVEFIMESNIGEFFFNDFEDELKEKYESDAYKDYRESEESWEELEAMRYSEL